MGSTYSTISLPLEEMFDKILDDPSFYEHIRKKVDKKSRVSIHQARSGRSTYGIKRKREFLKKLGFEIIQDELWREKTRT